MKFFKYCYFGAAAVLAALLLHLQALLLPEIRGCVLEKAGVGALSSVSTLATQLKGCIGISNAAEIAAIAVLAILVVAAGIKKGYLAAAYGNLERNNREWVVALIIAALAALPYIAKGNVVLGDAMQFSALSVYLKESLAAASYPLWNFYWYLGSATVAFYGWLYLMLAGILNFVVSIDAANKILFFAFHIISALLAYKLAKMVTGSGRAAIIAAAVYALSFEHIARIIVGRSITALTYVLVPALFIVYEKRLRKSISRAAAIGLIALASALLIFNHQADGAFAIAMFVIYAALRAIENARKQAVAIGAEIAAAMVIAAVAVSFWAVPMVLEQGEASGNAKIAEILLPHAPDFGLAAGMVAWPGKFGDMQMYYIGISAILLAGLGTAYLLRQRKFAISGTLIAAVILVLMQSPRHAPVMLLMLGISAGYGLVHLARKLKIDGNKALVIAIIIIAADLLPATAQLGYPDFSYNHQFYDTIRASGGERILDLSTDRRTFWPSYAYMNNKAETVFGVLIESAPKSIPYAAAITQQAAQEHYDREAAFSHETLQGLYMLGVKYVILHEEQLGMNPGEVFAEKRGSLGIERGLKLEQLNHSVAIASTSLEAISYEPQLEKQEGWKMRAQFEAREIETGEVEKIISEMGIDTAKATAEKILVKGAESEKLSGMAGVKVESVVTEPAKVTITYEAATDEFLQLSYSASEYIIVSIDGKETPFWETAINTIAVKTGKGRHELAIEGRQTPLRKWTLAASLAGLLVIASLLAIGLRKGKL